MSSRNQKAAIGQRVEEEQRRTAPVMLSVTVNMEPLPGSITVETSTNAAISLDEGGGKTA